MQYIYTDISEISNDYNLHESKNIDSCLLKNNYSDIIKAIEFLNSDEKYLYIHGFMGTGKRQFVSYLCEYLTREVIVLDYYCKESTVCDDIMLSFIDRIEKFSPAGNMNLNTKIATLTIKFQKIVSTLRKPILVILHSLDNVSDDNLHFITNSFETLLQESNVKIIITTCALRTGLIDNVEENKILFLKAFSKDIFKDFILKHNIKASDKQIEDLYSLTRGYYLYTALSVKLLQSLNITLPEFLQKIKNADSTFDNYLAELYISLIPAVIRNFFWFLRAIRHGISFNALAVLEIYDDFSIQYLQNNLVTFQANETLYLHDYFTKRVDVMLPKNTEIKLHKYIIGIYEQQLKEPLENRIIFLSRQALRSEIDYHTHRIDDIENGNNYPTEIDAEKSRDNKSGQQQVADINNSVQTEDISIVSQIKQAQELTNEDKITEAIELYNNVMNNENIDSQTLVEVRLNLARLYEKAGDNTSSMHYYELAETYYKNNNENINLNYLYYEQTKLYFKMYKHNRAIETIKKVIYSVDTPRSLMASACTLLGNIYADMNNPSNAYSYYQMALDSLDDNPNPEVLSDLYFKFALANDDNGDTDKALEYYSKCISIIKNNQYQALAYSNMASCYYENGNLDDALDCFIKAYNIEKSNNNYDGIYYTASHIANIMKQNSDIYALTYLVGAQRSAEFLNEAYYIVESSIALGDYYYNIHEKATEALTEYCKAKQVALNSSEEIDITNINKRIEDMRRRMPNDIYKEILDKYER